jgi:cephalosporin hydroxylase
MESGISREALPAGDYVSPNLSVVRLDHAFPNMIVGDTRRQPWKYLRRNIPHNWYVDRRDPGCGFLSRDEAHIVYHSARQFEGKRALEIGCWLGWSAAHMAKAGVQLDVVDPVLAKPAFHKSVTASLRASGVMEHVTLHAGSSPAKVTELVAQSGRKWSLMFIDGDHEGAAPLQDAIACAPHAEADALVLFHDLASPHVAAGLDHFRSLGWQTMVYETMQIMGVAWRGNAKPVEHRPDPAIREPLPEHLRHYAVSGRPTAGQEEFAELAAQVKPYTMLSAARLRSLYTLARQVLRDDLPGDFVECGTWKGGSAALLATLVRRYSKRPRRVYAFDTYEGMPEPADADRHDGVPADAAGYGAGQLKATMEENLAVVCGQLGVQDIVFPVKGLFKDTLPTARARIESIALLHADGDWYRSTLDILENLYDKVPTGGVIQIDDYGYWEGCRRAVHEFEAARAARFSLTPIDNTGVWMRKTADGTAARAAVPRTAAEFGRPDIPMPIPLSTRNPFGPTRLTEAQRGAFFHDLISHTRNFSHVKWLGHPIWQNVLDLWTIQETISEIRPALLVETGTNRGGSALFFAHLFDLMGQGRVVTVDVMKLHELSHPRVRFLIGSSTSDEVVREVRAEAAAASGPVMVILDSDHAAAHVAQELELYSPLVTPGSYLLVQDGVIDVIDAFRKIRPGPLAAIEAFLPRHAEFELDAARCERFLISHHPKGWLRRKP